MKSNQLIIHPMSKHLLPPPSDWPSNSVVTGFLELPARVRNSNPNEQVPLELETWLDRGEAPIYIGFGSIPVPNTPILKSIIQQLLTQTNHRIIYCLGWTKPFLDIEHDNLFVIDKLNHDWLFPRCKMAIIHGGIGTIGAALKAQLPLIIASIVVDQPFNGQMIEKLNVGIHIPFRKLSFDKLISAIDRILDGNYRINAKLIGEKMRLENGVEESVEIIENYIAKI
jgi:sterol 3beta-glucosyltransferase